MSKPMKTALMLAALAAGGAARADDLAWVFDTSARTPDVTANWMPPSPAAERSTSSFHSLGYLVCRFDNL